MTEKVWLLWYAGSFGERLEGVYGAQAPAEEDANYLGPTRYRVEEWGVDDIPVAKTYDY